MQSGAFCWVVLEPVVPIGMASLSAGCLVPRLRLVPRKSSALDGIVRPVSLPCCHHVEVRSLLGRDAARDGFTSDIHTRCLRIIPPFLVGWRELQNVQRV